MEKIPDNEIRKRLSKINPLWKLENNKITRIYETLNWPITIMLSSTIGFLAESTNHHPELILSYNKLKIKLNTHDINGISLKDLELAELIEKTVITDKTQFKMLTGNPNNIVTNKE